MAATPGTAGDGMRVVCRRADVEDVDAILSIVSDDAPAYRQRFGTFNVEHLIETSFLSVTAVAMRSDGDDGEPAPVVGFAAFSDTPVCGEWSTPVSGEAWMQWASTSLALPDARLPSTVWVSLLVTDDRAGYGPDVVDAVMRTTFTTLPDVDLALVLVPPAVGLFEPVATSGLFAIPKVADAAAMESLDSGAVFRSAAVLSCPRTNLIPTLRLRRAAVEDHDDLVPIFNSQSEVLTDQYGEFFLAELIEAQDDVHKALVAEVDGAAVGLMTISSRVDLALLSRCFELEVYNRLTKRSAAEEEAAARVTRARVRARRDWLTQIEAHGEELTAVLDDLVADPDNRDAVIAVPELCAALDKHGVMWGFENLSHVRYRDALVAAGLGLGVVTLSELGLDAAPSVTRSQFNAAIDDFSAARFRTARGLRLASWYTSNDVRGMAVEELEAALHDAVQAAARLQEDEAPAGDGDGKAGEDGGEDAEEESTESTSPVAGITTVTINTLASAISRRCAEGGVRYVAPGGVGPGEELLEELLDLMGPSWGVAAAKRGSITASDSKLEGGDHGGDATAAGAEESKLPSDAIVPVASVASTEGGGTTDGHRGIDRHQLEAALSAWEAQYQRYGHVRVLVTGNPKSGKATLAQRLSDHLSLPVVDGEAVLAAAEREAKRLAAEAAEAEARRKAAAEEEGEEYEPAADAEGKADEAQAASRFTGPFAPLLERLDEPDCARGFILRNLPQEPGQQAALSVQLQADGFAPQVELFTHASPAAAMRRSASEAEYSAAAAAHRRFTTARAQFHPAPPEWVPPAAVVALDADQDADAVFTAALDVLHRRRVVVDSQVEADEEAAVDAAMSGAGGGDTASSTPNAFSVTLFCVDEAFESRSQDFLHHAFATFPDRDYCVLTLPPTCSETALLSKFTLATPAADSTFEHVLYVAHRAALLAPAELVVRRAASTDRAQVLDLVTALPTAPDIMAAVADAEQHLGTDLNDAPPTAALVATLADQLVGVTVLSAEDASPAHLAAIREAFEVDMYLSAAVLTGTKPKFGGGAGQPPRPASAVLTHFAVNPIFLPYSRDLLRHGLRLYGGRHTVLYRHLPEETSLGAAPTILDDMIQIAPRRLPELRPGERPVLFDASGRPTQLSETLVEEVSKARAGLTHRAGHFAAAACDPRCLDHSLHFLTRRLCSEPKLRVNSRLVVVGASDTAVAFLQSVLLVPYLQFTNVTLVSPAGLPPFDTDDDDDRQPAPFLPGRAYSGFDLSRLAFHSSIRVVHRAVVAIDREAKTVGLDDGSMVPYDTLVLTAGLTEVTCGRLGYKLDGSAPPAFLAADNHGSVEALDAAARRLAIGGGGGAPVGGKRDVLALIDRGISGGRILYAHKGTATELPCLCGFADGLVQERVLAALADLQVEVVGGASVASVEEVESGDLAVKLDVADGDGVADTFALMVCGDKRNVDLRFFGAVNDAGLAYDGRLVVNHSFQTADDSIYACGTVTKFSRRYKAKRWLQDYNSKELGSSLAATVLGRLDPLRAQGTAGLGNTGAGGGGVDTFPQRKGPSTLPKFTAPRRTVARLPGGLHYLHVEIADYDIGKSGAELVTQHPRPADDDARFCAEERTCRVVLDKYGWVVSFLYVGPDAVEVDNLSTLVGRHESQLNALARDFAAGRLTDFVDFFRGDWAGAVLHDRFPALCDEVREALESDSHVQGVLDKMADMVQKEAGDKALARKRLEAVGQAGAALPPSTRRSVELHVLEHLRHHGALMPMYFLPGTNV